MAKIDKIKEFIGFLKVIFAMLVAIDSSLIAWLFKNSELNLRSSLVIFGILVSSLSIVFLARYILRKISQLEDM